MHVCVNLFCSAKYCKVWSTFGQVIPKIKGVPFLWFTVYTVKSHTLVTVIATTENVNVQDCKVH